MRTTTTTISAPTSGWNTKDPLDRMDPLFALKMINAYPDDGYVRTRRGYQLHCNTGIAADVNTLVELPLESGTHKLIACAGGRFVDVTTSNPVLLGPTITNSTWQHVLMNNRVLFFNGTDAPQMYDGTTWSQPTYNPQTHSLTISSLIQGCVYKNRLYVVQKNSPYVWHGQTNQFQGQLKRIDFSYILNRGGTVQYVSSWSRDTGTGLQDYFVLVSSEGEVLLYTGSDPEANISDPEVFRIAGRFFLAEPVAGHRGYLGIGSDLLIMHYAGITPVSALLAGANDSTYATITDNINLTFLKAVEAFGASPGWCAAYHSSGKAIYFNIPIPNAAQQFILNPTRGAWAQYTGMNAKVWCEHGNNLAFGSTEGKVYRADVGTTDITLPIKSEVEIAYNYFKDRARIKRFTMLRPHIRSGPGETFSIAVDVDFQTRGVPYTVSPNETFAQWNTGLWNNALWAGAKIRGEDVYSITALGRCAAIAFGFESSTGPYEFYAAAITFETGGLL